MRIVTTLTEQLTSAVRDAWSVEEFPNVVPTADGFGDYQSNVALSLGKKLARPPQEVARSIVSAFRGSDSCSSVEIGGPGFINFRLSPAWISTTLRDAILDPRFGVSLVAKPRRVIVDFSSPNVAKRMHVGHLRSTILGDAIQRTLAFIGHHVLGDNHLGDWGTQFGTLIWAWKQIRHSELSEEHDAIAELERLYQVAVEMSRSNEGVAGECRAELLKLQGGDSENMALWQQFVDASRQESANIYQRLGISFDLWRGESSYNSILTETVDDLVQAGIARESNGAVAVFFLDFEDLSSTPFLIRKTDGASLYATTDIATAKCRIEEYGAEQIIYVVDVRQSLHFRQLFATIGMMGYSADLVHVGFGMMLGPDGKPFRTRDGGTIRLKSLIDEASSRIHPMVRAKWPKLSREQVDQLSEQIGIGAIKYADLSHNRETDYRFEWDRFLNPDGNTGPYLLYTFVRAKSVLRSFEAQHGQPFVYDGIAIDLKKPEEITLGRLLVSLPDALYHSAEALRPHRLCEYIYSVARSFNAFYAACPVIWASDESVKQSRLALCTATLRAFEIVLNCLNIPLVEKM